MDKNSPKNITYYSRLADLSFYVIGNDENIIDSSINVTNKEIMKNDKPMPDGIYDAHMGTTDYSWGCHTCGCSKTICPGHFGSIDLKYPVKNPLFREELLKWLKIICFNCGKIVITQYIKNGKLDDYVKLIKQIDKCPYCNAKHYKIMKDKLNSSVFLKVLDENKQDSKNIKTEEILNNEINEIINKISDEDIKRLDVPLRCHPSNFIIKNIRVPPNTIRPDLRRSGGMKSTSSDITTLLKMIIECNERLPDEINRKEHISKEIRDYYVSLDMYYYAMIKNSNNEIKISNNSKPPTSLSERWTSKTGRIRKNLMGKRCSYMIRSVITGSPQLAIDELGISKMHASNIQIPEVVQPYNIDRLSVYFMNRNNKYPGCKHIIKKSDGSLYRIDPIDPNYKLQFGDIIYRDLIDGDLVCFNRQPSLSFNSISGFRIKIIESETIQLNGMACKGFNADFDGDQCNVIISQNIEARTEIYKLSKYDKWFISPQTRSPITGSFLDSLIGLVELSTTGIVLDKWHAMNILSDIHDENFIPNFTEKSYSGRDVISMLLPEIYISNKNPDIYKQQYTEFIKYNPADIKVNINGGKLTSGIIDKATVGQGKANSIYHIIANEYGNEYALKVCFNLSQLTDKFLLYNGFSTGIKDINISDDAMKKIKHRISTMILQSRQITEKLNTQKLIAPIGTTLQDFYEQEQLNVLSAGDEFIIPILADIDLWSNSMAKMILSGSKGNMSNFTGINAAIGNQTIGGKRFIEQAGWGRTSPYFVRYDTEPNSKGYISMSYREGVESDVFPFMAGEARHGAISNALTTSVTGAQSRISTKNLETIIIDNQRKAVKDYNIIQPVYAECGISPAKMEKVDFPNLLCSDEEFEKNYKGPNTNEYKQLLEDREILRETDLKLEQFNPGEYIISKSKYLSVNVLRIVENTYFSYNKILESKKLDANYVYEKVKELCDNLPYAYMNEIQRKSKRRIPQHYLDAVILLQISIRSNLSYIQLSKKNISNEMLDIIIEKINIIFRKSLIDPGTPVGVIAAHCVSEPMTQFILNSKHRVGGQGGTNTNTIERIKEILGAKDTDKMGSPTMQIFVDKKFEKDKIKVQNIASEIEMMLFNRFINTAEIFFEEYGNPIHPKFKHEAEIIKKIEKLNFGQKIPNDLANWCIRFSIDKEELIIKSITIENIILSIRKQIPYLYIIYTPENYDNIFIRCYIRNSLIKMSYKNYYEDIVFYTLEEIKKVILRGVEGIISTEIMEIIKHSKKEDGSLSTEEKIYAISTMGTNLKDILELPYIDPYRTQSDSLVEISKIYGITSARNKIVIELANILGNNYDNYFQTNLFADEMVYTGDVTSIQNTGLQKRENSNVTLRLSFQKHIQVAQTAAIKGLTDKLHGISGQLIVGSTPNIGTTYNEIIVNQEFIEKNQTDLNKQLEDI